MKFFLDIRFCIVIAAIAALGLTSSALYADEHREVGKYEVTAAWMVEPPLEGLKNGVSLRVTKKGHAEGEKHEAKAGHSHEAKETNAVEGLQDTLQVEVTHVPSGKSKTLKLRTVDGDSGHYTADIIPTAPGQYRFRFFGTIEGTSINETFELKPGEFHDVKSAADLQFPERLPEIREIVGVVRGTQNAAQQSQDLARQASDSASSASTLAIVGIVLGAVGIVSGVGGVVATLRRR